MPRYLIETANEGGSLGELGELGELAVELVGRRFPEVSVERRFEADDGTGCPRELWLCTAPSEAHIRRWAAAADLSLRSLSVATERGTPRARPTNPNRKHGGTP
jgi:hypothetical protein